MGPIKPPRPGTPIVAVLWRDPQALAQAESALGELLGSLAATSTDWPFEVSDYYEAEMGRGLARRFYTFTALCDPGELAAMKLATNRIEAAIAGGIGLPRTVNLDAGYLNGSKLVLASTKDGPSRIYLREAIFAEITLRYSQGKWIPGPHTYPDFASGSYYDFLCAEREAHLARAAAAVEQTKP